MGIKRQAAQRDGNERDIIDALRKAGHIVIQVSEKDAPDLIVVTPSPHVPVFTVRTPEDALAAARTNRVSLLEVKQHGSDLTPGQFAFHRKLRGHND